MPVSLRMKNLLQKNVSCLESNETKGCRNGVKGNDRKDGIGMKKLLALLLAVAMVFSFVGCGEEDNSNEAGVFYEDGEIKTPSSVEEGSWAIYWYLCGSDLETNGGFAT